MLQSNQFDESVMQRQWRCCDVRLLTVLSFALILCLNRMRACFLALLEQRARVAFLQTDRRLCYDVAHQHQPVNCLRFVFSVFLA